MLDYKPIGSGIQNLLGIPKSLMDALNEGGTHAQALGIGVLPLGKQERGAGGAVVGSVVGVLLGTPPELGPDERQDAVRKAA